MMTNTQKRGVPSAPKSEKTREQIVFEKYFKDNDDLLRSMRSLMFGLALSDAEKKIIVDTFADKELLTFIYRRFLPSYVTSSDKNTQIGGTSDVWLGVEEMLFGRSPEEIKQTVGYKALSIEMTQKALELLENPDAHKIDLTYSPALYMDDPLQINLLARNIYLRHIDKQLAFLYVISRVDTMSKAEIEQKLKMNSAH
jgi:hypothetical protein